VNELALFAGAGGGILGGHLLGWKTVCAVEQEPYAISVLLQRQNDKIFPTFPVWDDICTFDGRPWRGVVDVVSGGFPCQDISAAGKGAGIKGSRSGLWSEMARVIGEVKPEWVFAENSPMLVSRGLNIVLSDLASMGFNARWGIVGADDIGANHKRKRIWIVARNVANSIINGLEKEGSKLKTTRITGVSSKKTNVPHSNCNCKSDGSKYEEKQLLADTGCEHGSKGNSGELDKDKAIRATGTIHTESGSEGFCENVADTDSNRSSTRLSGQNKGKKGNAKEFDYRSDRQGRRSRENWWSTEPDVGRVVNGMAARTHRLKAIGNGQVPEVARRAWQILSKDL